MLGNAAIWSRVCAGQLIFYALILFAVYPAQAHTSEGGFVLLLPTGIYIIAGTLAVIVSLAIISFLPKRVAISLFGTSISLMRFRPRYQIMASLISGCFFWMLIGVGLLGPRDPLENLLVLVVWTLWWQAFLIVQAVFGNVWAWSNPWTGIYRLIGGDLEKGGFFQLPEKIGKLPAIVGYTLFGLFALADIAPDDPQRLAIIAGTYWIYIFVGMVIFGEKSWLENAECFTVLFRYFSYISPFAIIENKLRIGFPGWRFVGQASVSISGAVFVIMVLATGSFDGLNETFWWFGNIGVNPLEFPGRSYVVAPNVLGLIGANLFLVGLSAWCIWVGCLLAKSTWLFAKTFSHLALSFIPIAVGYHFSHYLTAFLVNVQYVAVALSDPLNSGADYFGLGKFFVSSGFLNSRDSVEVIWISQAAAVVIGHVIGVLSAHAIALKYYKKPDKALYSQLPLAMFMVAYTVFGLWLLATPRGV